MADDSRKLQETRDALRKTNAALEQMLIIMTDYIEKHEGRNNSYSSSIAATRKILIDSQKRVLG